MDDRADEIRSTRAPTLREDQIEVLSRYGQTRKTKVGEVLFRAGDTSNDFIVALEGEVEVIDDFAGEARTMGVMRARPFWTMMSVMFASSGRLRRRRRATDGEPVYADASRY
jgi:hypothetical protein